MISILRQLLSKLWKKIAGQKLITAGSLIKNLSVARREISQYSTETKTQAEKILVSIGLHFEIEKKPKEEGGISSGTQEGGDSDYEIRAPESGPGEKLSVSDFIGHFRSRYHQLQKILLQRPGLENLTSINKISGNRQNLSIIGMVTEKRVTKNKNLIIKFQDLTGEVNALAKAGTENFLKAQELQLDDVVVVKGSGNNEILFMYDIVFPDAMLMEKTRFSEDACVAFVSDVHAGSKKHLGKEFRRFLYWLNSDATLAKKIRYIFFVGDNVDGVGVYPGQERNLELVGLKDQYDLLALYLSQIPERIQMFMCPGQHDSVRLAEPQPKIDSYYGEGLYGIKNLSLVPNPCYIDLKEKQKRIRVLMYHGASIHSFINNIDELRLLKANRCPAKAVVHMLRRRHLAPTHSHHAVVYVPNAKRDDLVISDVPDIFCIGEVHRVDVENHNGVLIVTGSCWQSQSDFEEKIGNIPDPCKVPILSLKTHELKILDFGG